MSLFLIDISKPVLFIHIPKCGGSSIREGKDIGDGYRIYGPDNSWPAVPSFAFVRDPFDRVLSCWRDWRYNRKLTSLGFDRFVDTYVGDMQGVEDPTTVQHHLTSMTHPMHGIQHAEFVGRFELLQSDYDRFCDQFDIDRSVLPHLRQSSQHGGVIVNKSSMLRIESVYRDDYDYVN